MTSTIDHVQQDSDLQEGIVQLGPIEDGIAVLRLGAPSEAVVTFTERRLDSLREVLLRLQKESALEALIVTGSQPGMFAAGADISLIESIADPQEGERAAAKGQEIFGLCQQLKVPVVGAIEGPCLGGGFELALCFDLRLASDHKSTLVGLPEVKLGIIPGFGGTQRLPRLVGLPKALDVILKGKTLKAEKARRAGLVDAVVPSERLLAHARREARKLVDAGRKAPKRRLKGSAFWLSRVGPLRNLVRSKAEKAVRKGQGRFYDAPPKAVQLCVDAFALSPAEGLQAEAKALGALIVSPTCKNLVRLFFLTERSKRLGKGEGAVDLRRALVLGGGAMGAGIAGTFAGRGLWVRLCDLSGKALAAAKARMHRAQQKLVKRRSIKQHEAQNNLDRLAVSTDWGRLDQYDLFLEAVLEDLELKQKMFAQAVERGLPESAVIATNTSSLPIDAMAEGLPAPERLVGMHFFNPPEKMPLVEVIAGKRSSEAAVASVCRLAVKLGKFPVVVQDSPGFLVNRCLAPYLNEAAQLMVEGCDPEHVDKTMLDFGLPMGPARLMDEVGFDVAAKVSDVMHAAFPERMQPNPLFRKMVEAGQLGKKTKNGILSAEGKQVLAGLRSGEAKVASRSEILERLIYPMVDEAYRCLDEGLVAAEEDLDLGMVFGMGFPPFRGGITRYAKEEGLSRIVARLQELAESRGAAFAPATQLVARSQAAAD